MQSEHCLKFVKQIQIPLLACHGEVLPCGGRSGMTDGWGWVGRGGRLVLALNINNKGTTELTKGGGWGSDEGEYSPLWPAQTRAFPKTNASSCWGLGMTGGEVVSNPIPDPETSSSKGRPQSGGWPEAVPLIPEKNIITLI